MVCLVEAIAGTAIRDRLGLGGRRCDSRLVLFHLSSYLVLRRIALAVNRNRAVDGGDTDLHLSFGFRSPSATRIIRSSGSVS
jgi:hypothetical protein